LVADTLAAGLSDSENSAINNPRIIVKVTAIENFGEVINQELQNLDFDYFMLLRDPVRMTHNAIAELVTVAEDTGAPLVVAEVDAEYIEQPQFDWHRGYASINTRLIRRDFAADKKIQFGQPGYSLVLQLHLATSHAQFLSAQLFSQLDAPVELSVSALRLQTKLISVATERALVPAETYRRWLSYLISFPLQRLVKELAQHGSAEFDEFKAVAAEFLADADESIWTQATGENRAAVWAAIHGSREQALRLISA
jgi:hypothetical protein